MESNQKIKEEAYNRVLKARGSNDAPGFDLCVEAEIELIKNEQQKGE